MATYHELIERRIEKNIKKHNDDMELLGTTVFIQKIKPFCDKNGYDFVNGGAWGWMFFDRETGKTVDEYTGVPIAIIKLLNTECIFTSELWNYMHSYRDGEFED